MQDAFPSTPPGAQDAGELSSHVQMMHSAFSYLEDAGWEGYWLLIVVFSGYVCLALPTTPVEIAAGFIYGPFWGAVCGSVSKTIGSTLAFFLGRLLGRKVLSEGTPSKVPAVLRPKLSALQQQPFLTMIGIRLAPLPLAVKNYGLALCGAAAWPYIIASIAVNTPFSILWATTGASCHSLLDALSVRSSSRSTGGGVPHYLVGLLPALVGAVLLVILIGYFPSAATNGGKIDADTAEETERILARNAEGDVPGETDQ
mmetsp:Transcript_43203/g.101597  ORF Transcript_43203/g.101597 Transcript_43203/m.101597 type:complete len:257 (+) Transcript_43203:103-873(+)|eukprot:CAMPEP_0178431114 /NCGR_PEP_ID=MMETSP0689_2-20121128/31671_1 /TAXON_ID=160604 /ORGANISM="Amphidinium massartii, Strain CS-259" /LENGTH=256 /DNA_ID=CAMNT_0020052997 /DNA_START=33 /DNA_END=803 /DNA_ORIENTATION=+